MDAAEFYARRASKDGLHAWCKRCFRAYEASRRGRKRIAPATPVPPGPPRGRGDPG